MRQFIFIIGFFLPFNLFSQIDYSKITTQKLTPIDIDSISESIIVIHKKYAIIFFRQSDLKFYIESDKRLFNNYLNLTNLLSNGTKKIVLNDWWFDYGDEDRLKLFGDTNYTNDDRKYVNELYYIGADLIHDGKFMIKEKASGEIVSKNLRMIKGSGLYGTDRKSVV